MQIENLGSNQTAIYLANGTKVVFSYSTPVAAFIPGTGLVKTGTRYSVTTTRHVNRFVDGRPCAVVDQSVLDALGA
jgi:hypothetical protein